MSPVEAKAYGIIDGIVGGDAATMVVEGDVTGAFPPHLHTQRRISRPSHAQHTAWTNADFAHRPPRRVGGFEVEICSIERI
jgi:hypothetical protein